MKPRMPIEDRFWSKVDRNGPVPEHRPELGPCWIWTAFTNPDGYGMFGVGSRTDGSRRTILAYHWSYEQHVGPVPEETELDHLCRTRACVNYDHLRAVPHSDNVAFGYLRGLGKTNKAKTHCPQGHPYSEANTYITPRGERKCRTCNTLRQAQLRHR